MCENIGYKIEGLNEDDLFFIHHHHHYLAKNGDIIHELHHCPLFSKPDMKGKRFEIDHLYIENSLFHIIISFYEERILYDHVNNRFRLDTIVNEEGTENLYIKEKL